MRGRLCNVIILSSSNVYKCDSACILISLTVKSSTRAIECMATRGMMNVKKSNAHWATQLYTMLERKEVGFKERTGYSYRV